MSSTRRSGKPKAAGGRWQKALLSHRRRRALVCLLIGACCLLLFGCRQDMQDQPRYETYESSRFFEDGQASRPLVEGTVPRGPQYRDASAYYYTGKMDAAQRPAAGAGAGNNVPAGGGGGGALASAAAPGGALAGGAGAGANMQASGGGQVGGDVNVRGNVAGGIPGRGAPGGNANPNSGPDIFPFPITQEVLDRGQERFNVYCSMCHGMTGNGDGMIVRRGFRRPPSFHSEQLLEGNSSASHFFDAITNGWGAMPDYAATISAEDRWKIIAYVRALQLSQRARLEDVPPAERARLGTSGGGERR